MGFSTCARHHDALIPILPIVPSAHSQRSIELPRFCYRVVIIISSSTIVSLVLQHLREISNIARLHIVQKAIESQAVINLHYTREFLC